MSTVPQVLKNPPLASAYPLHTAVHHHDPAAANLALLAEREATERARHQRQRLFDWAYTFGRVFLAALFIWNGLNKAFAFEEARAALYGLVAGSRGILGTAIALELLGGVMLLTGLRVRFAAAALAVYVLAANLVAELAQNGIATPDLLFTNLGFVGGLLLLAAHGGGVMSLDRALTRRAVR